MVAWVGRLVALRREESPSDQVQRMAAAGAVARARATGTVAFGDIGNTLLAVGVLAEAGVPAVLFHEVLGFAPHDADAHAAEAASRVVDGTRFPVRPGLAPHAAYSVSPDLFKAVTRECVTRGLPSSVHLGEPIQEIELLETGEGELADALKALGAWNPDWIAPRTGPAEYLDRLGVLRPGLLVVHATKLTREALALVAARGCTIVSCPRSNRWVGAGVPPIDAFYACGAPVAFGTDSLASAPDLNMFAELAAARALSSVPARQLLESATRIGAAALGMQSELGTITPGKHAALVAVSVPASESDVEEYLVSGVTSGHVRTLAYPEPEPGTP
jgi:cytosine/adenosine deaminase-related metal-dependent hydrolase